jgi:hypothetical protein
MLKTVSDGTMGKAATCIVREESMSAEPVEINRLFDVETYIRSAMAPTALLLDPRAPRRPWFCALCVDCRDIQWQYPSRGLPLSVVSVMRNTFGTPVTERTLVMIHKGRFVKAVHLSQSDTTQEKRFRLAQMVRKAFAVSTRQAVSRPFPADDSPEVDDPYSVLSASPQDSDNEIKRKYKRLVADYHPDRVATLGIELRELAERKTKDINRAYAAIRRLRKLSGDATAAE